VHQLVKKFDIIKMSGMYVKIMEQLVGVQVGLSLIKVSLPNFIYRQVIGKQNRWINCVRYEHTDSRKNEIINRFLC
jgi:hypothetical protein